MSELLAKAQEILRQEVICNRCLGRCFAKSGTGLTNEERGKALRVLAAMHKRQPFVASQECSICQSIFTTVDRWVEQALQRIEGYEFQTYLMGTRIPLEIEAAERSLWEKYHIGVQCTEPIKQEFNREVGKRFGIIMSARGQPILVDFREPEVVFLMDLERNQLKVRVHSLFLYGRYRKLVRGIPQTKWPCRTCRGRGCEECDYTGKTYPESVEELIAEPVLRAAKGKAHALHAAGREDVDARMLGSGRPFVLEITSPRKRSLDLELLTREINRLAQGKVEVGALRFVKSKVVEHIKELEAQKSYRADVALGREIHEEELQHALHQLIGDIEQRTPRRVRHRRADLVRTRRVLAIDGRLTGPCAALIEIVCDGGLYVKELISGDEARTRPSLSGLLGTRAQVVELDVLDVLGGINLPET